VTDNLADDKQQIISCNQCSRLRTYCHRIAAEKRAAYRHETYWGRPVPGFGDPRARVLVLGLAPAAHGANRTGRVFTGDGPLGSGDFLMRAMHAHGFASISTSQRADDGLILTDAFIASGPLRAARQQADPDEIAVCHAHLSGRGCGATTPVVIIALGRIAFDSAWRLLGTAGSSCATTPVRSRRGVRIGGYMVIGSYHPSREHNTGLTPAMMDAVFARARRLAGSRL
jgi:uracil-DNA glycosylase